MHWIIREMRGTILYYLHKREWDEPVEMTPQLQAFLDDIEKRKPVIPDFVPEHTALFTSVVYRNRYHYIMKKFFYKRKIRNDCLWLIEHGYTHIIVSYGNPYGLNALKELLKLRREGKEFMLYCGKVLGEHRTMMYDGLKIIELCSSCDKWFGLHSLSDFLEKVFYKINMLSSECLLYETHQKVHPCIFTYYIIFNHIKLPDFKSYVNKLASKPD